MLKNLAKHALSNQIANSEFEFLEVRSSEGTSSVSCNGELYGVIGALGIFINDMCKQANIPQENFITMVSLACEICGEWLADEQEDGSIDLQQFIKVLKPDEEEK